MIKQIIKRIKKKLTWKKEKCPSCLYLKCVSNESPCCDCIDGNQWERNDVKV